MGPKLKIKGTVVPKNFMENVVPVSKRVALFSAVFDPAASSPTGFKRLVFLRLPDEFSATFTADEGKGLIRGLWNRLNFSSDESKAFRRQVGSVNPLAILMDTTSVPGFFFATVNKSDGSEPVEPKLKTTPKALAELEQFKSKTVKEAPNFWNTADEASDTARSDGRWRAFVKLYDGLNKFVPKDVPVQQSYQKLSKDGQKKRQEELKKIMKQFL